jgi:hypothetical protein
MQFSSPIKPISGLKSHAAQIVIDNSLSRGSLLKLLALGKLEIEEGKFKDAEVVFAQLELQ